ncbi:MAG: VWA domain-containing protein [Stappiaceae bacterium]
MMPDFYALEAFHFIRPWILLAIAPICLLWWLIRRSVRPANKAPEGIAPHLADALTVGNHKKHRLYAIDGVVVILVLIATAAAGPTWSRVPNPLLAQTAPVVIILKVAESMLAVDVSPNRLERGKQKITDLLAERSGARSALIAYAGTAHRVTPLTEDPAVIQPFLEGLSPAIMPVDGDNASDALALARSILATEETPGAILFVLDELDRADMGGFEELAEANGPNVVFLAIGSSSGGLADLERLAGNAVIQVTPDTSDILTIERRLHSAFQEAMSKDERQKWDDRGWLLAWPAMVLMLFWFRRGWTMRWAVVLICALSLWPIDGARAEGWKDWFLTPDQQGQLAVQNRKYKNAAEFFEDPYWKGYALHKDGQYAESAAIYARLPGSEAANAQGVSLIKGRAYREGIAAFEKALERNPGNDVAAQNLALAEFILDYVETSREQSDTGEDAGIGADEVVFDNEAARGTETQIVAEKDVVPQTAEQWMRTVDTRTSDFLKMRFALEAAGGAQ